MSVTYTADVFCEGQGCSMWVHGVTAHDRPPPKSSARLTAARTEKWVHVKGKDYCPDCAKKLENKNDN